MLTDIRLQENGTLSEGRVYQNVDDKAQFLVIPAGGVLQVIIDRKKQQVGTMGVAGISLHPYPDGDMVVCLEPAPGTGILGVPLSDTDKTGAPTPPVFSSHSVDWTWGDR